MDAWCHDWKSAVSPVGNRRGEGGFEWLDCLRIDNPRYSRLPVGAMGKGQRLAPKGHGLGRKRFPLLRECRLMPPNWQEKSISIFVVFPQEWGGEEFCLTP